MKEALFGATDRIAIAGAAFVLGLFCAPRPPTKVEVEERVEYRDRVLEVVRTVEVAAARRDVARTSRREVVRETRPDGTQLEREVTTRGTLEREEASTSSATEAARAEARELTAAREVTVAPAPGWRMSVLVGADLGTLSLTALPRLEVGGLVETTLPRIPLLPSITAGVWATSAGRAGLALGVAF